MKRIALVDYGMGNLHSAHKGFLREGLEVFFADQPHQLAQADALILPGVGHFGSAMEQLVERQLVKPLLDFAASGRPFLGVCLGLQIMFEESEESPGVAGLGIFRGMIRRFRLSPEYKIPHMGWNSLSQRKPSLLFEGLNDGVHAYFVHSYYADPWNPAVIAAESHYGLPFCAAVEKGNIMATQFHPEKSQAVGRRIIDNFARFVLEGEKK